jgi:hypothetical protein
VRPPYRLRSDPARHQEPSSSLILQSGRKDREGRNSLRGDGPRVPGGGGPSCQAFAFPVVVTFRLLFDLGIPAWFLPPAVVEDATLLRVAGGLALPVLGTAAIVGVCGLVLLRQQSPRVTAAGIVLALAVEAFLFQVTLIAWSVANGTVATGAYVGLVARGVMLVGAWLVFKAFAGARTAPNRRAG